MNGTSAQLEVRPARHAGAGATGDLEGDADELARRQRADGVTGLDHFGDTFVPEREGRLEGRGTGHDQGVQVAGGDGYRPHEGGLVGGESRLGGFAPLQRPRTGEHKLLHHPLPSM